MIPKIEQISQIRISENNKCKMKLKEQREVVKSKTCDYKTNNEF